MSNKNNLEAKIQQVDEILAKIESGEVALAEISGEYKKAVDLAQEVEVELNQMKNEIEIISKDFSKES